MSTHRASLLAGLRTGGVRSVSIPRFQQPLQDEEHIPSMPFTAAVDGPAFSHHQKPLNPNSAPFSPAFSPSPQLQALQMQMMQLEILRLQVRPPLLLFVLFLTRQPPRTSKHSNTRQKSLHSSSSASSSRSSNRPSPGASAWASIPPLPPVPRLLPPSICVRLPNPVVPTKPSCSGLSSVFVLTTRSP